MKITHLLLTSVLALASSAAFACHTPTCTSSPDSSTSTSAGITGNISNGISSSSTSYINQGGASLAMSTAHVSETAGGTAWASSNKNSAPNGLIGGSTYTNGTASVTGLSASTGTGQAMTSGVAYGTATATSDAALVSKSGNAQLNLSGSATSGNQVGIGYATQSSGNGIAVGGASVAASTANQFQASGVVNACNTPITGSINDSKLGSTMTNAPVINQWAAGNASGNAFSPFTNNSTSTATQNVNVTGSFSATK